MTHVTTLDRNAVTRAPASTPDWLQPLSEQQPCGPSLEYDAEYAVLLSRLLPRGEAQYGNFVGSPEVPNWAEIERDCRRLLMRTKDIGIVIWLARARTRLSQAVGLAQMLAMLLDLLHTWPEDVHPQMLVDGEIDPVVRANALAALADPDGLIGDVREILISGSTAMRLNVRDVERAFANPRVAGALNPEAVVKQLADLRESAGGDESAPVYQLELAARHAQAIDGWCMTRLDDAAPRLEGLLRLLNLFLPTPQQAETQDVSLSKPRTPAPAAGAVCFDRRSVDSLLPDRAITGRADVLHAMRAARRWLETNEPSSPVTALLKQAERMVGKRFSQVADAIPLDLLRKWDSPDEDESVSGVPT